MKFLTLTIFFALFSLNSFAQTPHTASLSLLQPEVNERGGGRATFQVQLVPAAQELVQVLVDVTGITATAGEDFVPETKVLTFAPGEMVKYVDVNIIDDVEDELLRETFQAVMTPVTPNVMVSVGIQQATIIDDDEVFYIESATFEEGDEGDEDWVSVSMTRKFPSREDIRLTMKTVAQSATSPSDYLTTSTTLTAFKDDLRVSMDIPIIGDDVPEAEETFTIDAYGEDQDIMIENPGAPITIVDNDEGVLALRFSSASEGSDGRSNFTMNETFESGPVRLKLVEDEGEKYYESETVIPKYRFFVPGQITFPSKPGEFKVVKLSGLNEGARDIENISVHYSITPKKMRCQMAAPIWMECPWGNMHPLVHEYDIHPGTEQLPGLNIVATRFEAAHESTDEGLVIGKRVTSATISLDQMNGAEFTEDLVIEIMRVPEN